MRNSKILQNSSIYSLLALLQKGINFLMVPILTIYLTPFDYGIVAVVTAISAFLSILYTLSLNGSANRFYYEYKDDKEKIKRFFGTIITFVILISISLSVILGVGHQYLLDPFLDNVTFFPYMLLGMVSVLFNPIFAIYQTILQAKQRGKEYGKNNLFFFLTNLTFILIGVVVLRLGAKGVIGALSLTNIIFCALTVVRYRNEFSFGVDKFFLKQALNYSLPLVPHSLSGVATAIIDRLFINHLLSTSITGIYTLGSTFGGIIFLISSGVNQAFVPWFNGLVKMNNHEKIPRVAELLVLCYCLVALGISFFGKEVIAWVTPEEYHDAWLVLPFISFAFVYHGVYYFFSAPLFYNIEKNGSRVLPLFTISAAILNMILNYFLIIKYGMVGASGATLITKLILVLGLSRAYKKFVSIAYSTVILIVVPALFFLISLAVFYFTNFDNILVRILIFLVILLLTLWHARKELKIIRIMKL
ncbi:lipopolysaccharide biosynthesis protein [Ulvibacterium marinum]|uniref:Polysaccharide biosynthesis protein C-terminal domain-containing protein n=1 Tax=Ulvibacterium marinum TaxID=2419782 RepID=A0A3B0CFZ7_9FLAO|nr:oligosaccharide flippase family protein [Ulvibacterium marinum]RKN82767.1 hypothetical protein D7Z94_02695 [Ulvibacterium marinum]